MSEAIATLGALIDDLPYDEDLRPVVAAKTALAGLLWRNKEIEESLNLLQDVYETLETLPVSADHIKVHQFFGHIYLDLSSYDQALKHYLHMRSHALALDEARLQVSAEGSIGLVYSAMGESARAIKAHEKVIAYATKHGHRLMLVQAHYFLAQEYIKAQRPEDAIRVANNITTLEMHAWESLRFHSVLAHAHAQMGDDHKATAHYQASLEFEDFKHFEFVAADVWIGAGTFLAKIGDHAQAIDLLERALSVSVEHNYPKKVCACHEGLYTIYKALNQWERALHHHEQLRAVSSTIFKRESENQTRVLEITYRMDQLHEAKEQQRREFAALTELKDRLLSDMSHDLKNPLMAIKSAVYVIKTLEQRAQGQHDVSTYLDHIDAMAERMNNLILDVLDDARLNVGLNLKRGPVSLFSIISGAIETLQEHARRKTIRICHDNVKDIMILAAPRLLQRAVENILSNAIKYAPPNTSIQVCVEDQGRAGVALSISDSGQGIPAHDLPHIFDRFYRGTSSTSKEPGTGLGMAIAKNIVEKHHGQISVSSVQGAGTTVVLSLPTPRTP